MITESGQKYIDTILGSDDCHYECENEDALNQEGNVSLDEVNDELTTYYKCAGCDFPHHSEQQAINCCPPVQVFACPQCDSFRYSEQEARECC